MPEGRPCIERVVGGMLLPLLLMTEWLLLGVRPLESGTGVVFLGLFGICGICNLRVLRSCGS